MPLILGGSAKKVVALSTGMADLDSMNKHELHVAPGYAISKAAMNVAVGKFHAQYKKEGVLFMSISPGVVDTGHYKNGMITASDARLCYGHALTALLTIGVLLL